MSIDKSTPAPRWLPLSPPRGPLDPPAPTVNANVEFAAQSRRGPQRPTNTDHYLIVRVGRQLETILTSLPAQALPQRFDEFGYGMLVADGIGSDSGEAASRLALTTFAHMAVHAGKWNVRIDEPIAEEVMDRGRRFYRGVDATLLQAGLEGSTGLRTTLTAVFIAGSELFFAHVGHSRAHLFRDGALMQLTRDHTVAGAPHTSAPIVDMAAGVRDLHRILTDAIGMPGPTGPRIDIGRCGLLHDDVLLLCTNGLTDVIEEARIDNVLRRYHSPDDQCRALVELVEAAGGEDDATVLVSRYRTSE